MSALSAIYGGGYSGRENPRTSQQGWAKDLRDKNAQAIMQDYARRAQGMNEEQRINAYAGALQRIGAAGGGGGLAPSGSSSSVIEGDRQAAQYARMAREDYMRKREMQDLEDQERKEQIATNREMRNEQRNMLKKARRNMGDDGVKVGGNYKVTGGI
jgi:hypothetical protein